MNYELMNYELKVLWRSGAWTRYRPIDKDELTQRIQDIMPYSSWVSIDVTEIQS